AAVREQRRFHVLDEDGVELRDRLRRAVVALHEHLAGAASVPGGDAVLTCQRVLVVEQNALLAAAGEQVQAQAQPLEEVLLPSEAQRFAPRDQPALGEIEPGRPETGGAAGPQNGLQIAQAAGRFLDVRLEAVGAVVELGVPLLLFEQLGAEEAARIHAFGERRLEGTEQRAVAAQTPRLQQRGAYGDVLFRLLVALSDGAHAVAQFDAQVPQAADETLHGLRGGC